MTFKRWKQPFYVLLQMTQWTRKEHSRSQGHQSARRRVKDQVLSDWTTRSPQHQKVVSTFTCPWVILDFWGPVDIRRVETPERHKNVDAIFMALGEKMFEIVRQKSAKSLGNTGNKWGQESWNNKFSALCDPVLLPKKVYYPLLNRKSPW